jgi:prolyl-tRNA synthetase
MVLAMTHEEVFTWLAAREFRSYRDVPQIWYQIQLKFRDEARPKGGILRVREFLMKDSYSFDIDEAGLEVSYAKHIHAYDRIFERCGLAFHRVESDPGMMGGAQAHEYMAPSAAGEDKVALCDACGYAANVELARSVAPAPEGEGPTGVEEVATPDQRTIKEVAAFLGVPVSSLVKSLLYMVDETPVLALVRGDHELHEGKLARALRGSVRPAHAEEVREALGVEVGFVGPVGVSVRVVADESLAPDGPGGPRGYVVGANTPHTHLRGVVFGRDVTPEYVDLREAESGDACTECGASLRIEQVIEVGNIFKLGTKYSAPLGATVLDESGVERPLIMGSYGIGPARIMAAAIEQRYDDRGAIWPKTIAPFDVSLLQVQMKDEDQSRVAAQLYQDLGSQGWEILWDDRDVRAGVKFADAELVGCPVRVTVGRRAAEGVVEIVARDGGTAEEVAVADVVSRVAFLWEQAR